MISSVLVFVGIAVLMVALLVYAHKRAEARRKALNEWAQSHGFSFDEKRTREMENRYSEFDVFRVGRNRHARNVMHGRAADRFVCAFDYHYETQTHNGKTTQTHHHVFSVVMIETRLPLKSLSIRQEGFFDRVGEFLGFDDIDFEMAEFNRAFHVKAPDRRWAFDMLPQETMEYLLASPRYSLVLEGGTLMVHRSSEYTPAEFEEALALGTGLLDRIPRSVMRELHGES